MIIQINATVCAAADHGEDSQHKIAGGDHFGRVLRGEETSSDQEKQEIKGAWQKRRFFRR
jgi:hypothetical protein